MTRRRGISLVEVMVATAVSGVVLSLVAVCLHGLYRAEHRARQFTSCRASIARLSLQLRTDAHATGHAARSQPTPDAEATLVLTLEGGRQIEYRYRAELVERLVTRDGQTVQREAYRLPGTQVAWQVADDGARPLVTAVLATLPEPGVRGVEPSARERIEAVVGALVKHQAKGP
jgi:prepilin-type N-terminal cleavage/methylation domain-containing protein